MTDQLTEVQSEGLAAPPRRGTTPSQDFVRGIWNENPVFVQMLGLCPVLAVTNTVANSLAMGLATFFVLMGSSLLVSTFRRLIPNEVRISTYILIIATFVTLADIGLEALVPDIHKALGPFVALIVCNCLILGRQEAFASKKPIGRSLLDASGTGIGFVIALMMMGVVREVLGNGTILDYPVMGPSFEPWVIMVLPPGGFFTIGILLLFMSWVEQRRQRARERDAGATKVMPDTAPVPVSPKREEVTV
jgi:Na+-translocating ferredoxin:NAD+ oxidoreductase subunit E